MKSTLISRRGSSLKLKMIIKKDSPIHCNINQVLLLFRFEFSMFLISPRPIRKPRLDQSGSWTYGLLLARCLMICLRAAQFIYHSIEQLIEDLKNENDNLRVKIVSMHEQYKESQKLLLQERQKTKALYSEVEALKETLEQKYDILESATLGSPCIKSSNRLEDSNECLPMKNSIDTPSGQNRVQSENAAIMQREIHNENILVLHDEHMNESLLPNCCRLTKTNYGNGTDRSCSPCALHILLELLIGMKVSVECQSEGLCFSVIHQISGYNFTLSWVGDNDGREELLFYRVSSLGTIENIALEWMKDDMVFSLAMCPVFFDKLCRIVGHK